MKLPRALLCDHYNYTGVKYRLASLPCNNPVTLCGNATGIQEIYGILEKIP